MMAWETPGLWGFLILRSIQDPKVLLGVGPGGLSCQERMSLLGDCYMFWVLK